MHLREKFRPILASNMLLFQKPVYHGPHGWPSHIDVHLLQEINERIVIVNTTMLRQELAASPYHVVVNPAAAIIQWIEVKGYFLFFSCGKVCQVAL